MTEEHSKQSTEHIVREVARSIVPLALEATGNVDCIAHAKMLRALADDASMGVIRRACQNAAYAAYDAAADAGDAADATTTNAADSARYVIYAAIAASANADGSAIADAAEAVNFAANSVGDAAKQEYAAILVEATWWATNLRAS